MNRVVRLTGRGRVEVAAYGIADAEHLVEKEISRLFEEARVGIVELARLGEERRIAEEFRIGYRVVWDVVVSAPSSDAARVEALRRARERVGGTRYQRIEWEKAEMRE